MPALENTPAPLDLTARPAPRARDLARLLIALLGAGLAIALALAVVGPPVSPFLLASLGGSTVFLLGLTRAPAAQPRALFGGHLIGALVGIACVQWLGDALWVYALAQCLALGLMLWTGTVHPPAGANPLLMVYAHAGWSALWSPVLLGVACLAGFAALYTRLVPGHVHYPVQPLDRSPPTLWWGAWND